MSQEEIEFNDLMMESFRIFEIYTCNICDDDFESEYDVLNHVKNNHTLKELREIT